MTAPGLICVFAKPPLPGQVKTRLAVRLGRERAAALAAAFLEDTWSLATSVPWARAVLAATGESLSGYALTGRVEAWPQGEGDLGARMERVARRALTHAPYVLVIGSDSPGLPLQRLAAAREALREVDAVLGPAEDGGFYLVGLRRCPPGLFDALPWSAPSTYAATRERLLAHGLTLRTLEPFFDVDRPEDLERLRRLLARGELHAPASAKLLLPARRRRAAQRLARPTLAALRELAARTQAKTPRVLTRRSAGHARHEPQPSVLPRVSVVMPVLDEASRIERALSDLLAVRDLHEILVVDGGSQDRTCELVGRDPRIRLIRAERGRARQMNAGARLATGEVVLFLHADVTLPLDAVRRIAEALRPPDVVGGAFRTWTVADVARPPRWAPLLHLADFRSRYSELPYGDQAPFVRLAQFHALGGFAEIALMEDLELSTRLRRTGRIVTIPARVLVSGRRMLARPVHSLIVINVFPLLYWLGVSPKVLSAVYGQVR